MFSYAKATAWKQPMDSLNPKIPKHVEELEDTNTVSH